jgi:hypothetical protein
MMGESRVGAKNILREKVLLAKTKKPPRINATGPGTTMQ